MSDDACCTASRDPEGDRTAQAASDSRSAPKPTSAPDAPTAGMVRLEGGSFLMGTDSDEGFPADGEGPVRKVHVDPFYIDIHHVTNAEFEAFIKDTGYVTDAERYGWSFVFQNFVDKKTAKWAPRVQQTPWWVKVDDARWKWPEGRGSHVSNRQDHPVVHVSWNDAQAYCEWAGLRLPTEAEWEYAARGGLEQKQFPWGDKLHPDGQHMCNIWQGSFPDHNTVEDAYYGTAPVKSFPPNGYGLYEVAGNAWEWCYDWFSPDFHVNGPRGNPTGPAGGEAKVMRGGSYLCHHSYCNRYRVAARSANTPDSTTGNLSFRCAADA